MNSQTVSEIIPNQKQATFPCTGEQNYNKTDQHIPHWIRYPLADHQLLHGQFRAFLTHSNWRLLARRHAHPDQQRCDGAHSCSTEGSQKMTESTPKARNTLAATSDSIVIVLPTVLQQGIIHPPLVGEPQEHAPCCLVTLPAVKAAFAWEASVPLSREAVSSHAMCKSVKLLLCASARLWAPRSHGAVSMGRLSSLRSLHKHKAGHGNVFLQAVLPWWVLDLTNLNCFCCGLSGLIFSSPRHAVNPVVFLLLPAFHQEVAGFAFSLGKGTPAPMNHTGKTFQAAEI